LGGLPSRSRRAPASFPSAFEPDPSSDATPFRITPLAFTQTIGPALRIAVLGFPGGLVLSAIKRDRGIKDWGAMIEGHGGMLDRMDSITFAAPVFFHVTRFFFQP
jgi:phosphatidate cytidylyltransferase